MRGWEEHLQQTVLEKTIGYLSSMIGLKSELVKGGYVEDNLQELLMVSKYLGIWIETPSTPYPNPGRCMASTSVGADKNAPVISYIIGSI